VPPRPILTNPLPIYPLDYPFYYPLDPVCLPRVSPLYMAVLNGHLGCARLLIDSGAYGADYNQVG
jgi:hypothetical protein